MIIERIRHSGALVLSDSVGEGASGYLYTRTYYGFTQAQAIRLFKIALAKEGE
jgi:HKD family nuclease